MYAKTGFIHGWLNICLQPLTNFLKKLHLRCLTRFMPLVSFDTTLKTSENQRFSDVFRGYRRRPVTWNRLTGTARSVQIRSYFWSVFSPNAGKYGPEITPYLDTFHSLRVLNILFTQ